MEQQFINTLNTKGWLAAIAEHKMPTEFWMQNFKSIPDNSTIYNAILDQQELEENFIALVQKKGWMDGPNNNNWAVVSYKQKLSEDFIRQFKDKLDWEFISLMQELSEQFIEEFNDKVDWWHIARCQKLSEAFVERHRDRMNEHQLKINKHK